MKTKTIVSILLITVVGLLVAGWAGPGPMVSRPAAAADAVTLTVLNPQGPIAATGKLAPRLSSLAGKTIALWLSATPDELYAGKGGPFYDRLAELLTKQFPDVKIIPYSKLPMKYSPADEVIAAIQAAKPDGVVVALGG